MRNTHGQAPARAVGGSRLPCYHGGRKLFRIASWESPTRQSLGKLDNIFFHRTGSSVVNLITHQKSSFYARRRQATGRALRACRELPGVAN